MRPVDEGATETWKREIEPRPKPIDDGTVDLISWSAARGRLRDWRERWALSPCESILLRWKKPRRLSIARNEAGGLPGCFWMS
jgi:hypothetical protein